MDSETDSSCDESVDDQVMVSTSGSLIVLNPSSTSVPRPSTSSSSHEQMTVDEQLIFSKLEGKLRLKNLRLIQLNKDPDNPLVTTLVCESNSSGTTLSDKVAKFKIIITIGSPLSLEPVSAQRPQSPLFEPIEDSVLSDFFTTCQDFARTTRSLMTLLDFIDSYLEKSGCADDTVPASPVSDILRELQIRSDNEDDDHASASDIIPSSGSTASRRSSRSTTPTMSDRIE